MNTLQVIFGIILPILTMGAGAAFMYVQQKGKVKSAEDSLVEAKKISQSNYPRWRHFTKRKWDKQKPT